MNFDKTHFQFYALVRFKLGKSAVEVEEDLEAAFPDDCPSLRTIYRWFEGFPDPHHSLGDAARSGRPCSTRTEENIEVVKEFLEEDPRISVREIADCLKIDHKSVHRILTSDLQLRKVCSVWVPHDLTDDQRQARVKCAKQIRKVFRQRGMDNILNCLATEDETWIYLEGKKARPSTGAG